MLVEVLCLNVKEGITSIVNAWEYQNEQIPVTHSNINMKIQYCTEMI